jgi:cardiolipin synthase A/B
MALREQPWWIRIFVALGILTTIGIPFTLFFALGRRPTRMSCTETPPVTAPEFLTALAGNTGSSVEEGGEAKLLRNGDRYFPAILEDIRHARKTVHFTVYIWEQGQMSDTVARALEERARAGVAVRLMLDSFGANKAPKEQLASMEAAGVKIAEFRKARPGRFARYNRRSHRRAIVIDGRIGYTGGAAVADKWLGDARNDKEWRDDMVRVTGPMARSLQTAFAELWAGSHGEILVGPDVYPPLHDDGSGVKHVGLSSSPTDDQHPLRLFFALSFLAARHKLYIASSYFVPDKFTRRFVTDQARAGVDVRILVPGGKTDAGPIRQACHSYFEELLEAGVRVYEYQPTMMHAKYVVVDGKWSVVGSANMDIRSKELNSENVLGILDPGLARDLEASFMKDMAQSEEFHLETWRKRGPWAHLKERTAALFVEQY